MITIALDAMGGDHAPTRIIQGAEQAVEQMNVHVVLVGHLVLLVLWKVLGLFPKANY